MKQPMYAPWVPAAGHIARNGYWHPGAPDHCPKTPCAEDREAAEEEKRR